MESSITEILTNIHGIKTILMREIRTLEINDYIKANPSWFLIDNNFKLNDNKSLEINLLSLIKKLKPAYKDKQAHIFTLKNLFSFYERITHRSMSGNRRISSLTSFEKTLCLFWAAISSGKKNIIFDLTLTRCATCDKYGLISYLKSCCSGYGINLLFITDDTEDVFLADVNTNIFYRGRIIQSGMPMELYNNPVNPYVASIMSFPPMGLFEAKFIQTGKDSVLLFGSEILVINGKNISDISNNLDLNEDFIIGIYPKDLCPTSNENADFVHKQINDIFLIRGKAYAKFYCGNYALFAELPADTSLKVGDIVNFSANQDNFYYFTQYYASEEGEAFGYDFCSMYQKKN